LNEDFWQERKQRAACKRAGYMQTQIQTQREQEESEAARLEYERMEKLKRRGFAGYGGSRSEDSGSNMDAEDPLDHEPGSPNMDLMFYQGIHPENLVGVAKKEAVSVSAVSPRKKQDEAMRQELAKKDQEAWGDRMPPPNKVVESVFRLALPSAEDVLGAIEPGVSSAPPPLSMGGMQEVTASGRVVDLDPRALELIKIAEAFESDGATPARQDAAPVRASRGAHGGGAGGGFQSSVLQSILQKGGAEDIVQGGGGAEAAAAAKAPASTAPKGFSGGGALGALLAKSGSQAGQAPAVPPVVLWGRPAPAAGGGGGGVSGARAGGGASGLRSEKERGGGAHGIKAHAHASDLLGAVRPHAPASDLLGSRLPPPGAGGHVGAGKRSSVLANHVQGHTGTGAGATEAGFPGDGADRPVEDAHTSMPPAAPLSVADASVITKFSETPGWGAYAATDRKVVVERRKAVVQEHAGMFTLMGDFFFGTRGGQGVGKALGSGVGAGEDGANSDSDEDVQKANKSPKRRVVPPSPASSAHLRELLVNSSAEQGPMPVAAAEEDKAPGPLTMMGSWMPGITAWEWNATLNSPNTPNGDHTQQLPSETPHGAAASPPAAGSVARDSHNAAGAAEDGEQDAASGFAAHGLGTKVWRLRRRTIPIKPMTADERELYEQGKLGVEQFVIEEEEEGEEEEEEEEEAIPAPPSADLIHQAFANTMGGNEEATPAQRSSPPQNRISPSKISALFAEMGAADAAKLQESAPSHIAAPPSDAEKLDMMRIFAEAEGVGASWGDGGYGAGESARVLTSEPGGEVDVSKLSDEELVRQLQLAQQQLLRGAHPWKRSRYALASTASLLYYIPLHACAMTP